MMTAPPNTVEPVNLKPIFVLSEVNPTRTIPVEYYPFWLST